jgi:hypothetical protein
VVVAFAALGFRVGGVDRGSDAQAGANWHESRHFSRQGVGGVQPLRRVGVTSSPHHRREIPSLAAQSRAAESMPSAEERFRSKAVELSRCATATTRRTSLRS